MKIPSKDISSLPAPFDKIHRINWHDGLLEARDQSGRLITLVPVETAAELNQDYGALLGVQAQQEVGRYLHPRHRSKHLSFAKAYGL